ncbi:MAG: DegV family protein [Bacillus sp. (in: firmicutes)]
MTKKIAWITDSTAYIPDGLKNHPDLYIVPLTITFSSGTYEDGIDLDTTTLYRNIREDKEIPKTSQPSVGKFAELFEKLKESYDAAIAIHISSGLSGTLSSCQAGAELAGFPVETVDSLTMSVGITRLLELGMEMHQQGVDYKEISSFLNDEAYKTECYMVLGNLDQFYKGGRMSGTQYLLGNLLSIKPIITIYKGKFELLEKVRSEKKAAKRIMELFSQAIKKSHIKKAYIMHGNVMDKALQYKEDILALCPSLDVVICELTSTISAHSGEGTVVVAWANDHKH